MAAMSCCQSEGGCPGPQGSTDTTTPLPAASGDNPSAHPATAAARSSRLIAILALLLLLLLLLLAAPGVTRVTSTAEEPPGVSEMSPVVRRTT
jgi:hypothetical protein